MTVKRLLKKFVNWRRRVAEARLAPQEALRRLGGRPYKYWCHEFATLYGVLPIAGATIACALCFIGSGWEWLSFLGVAAMGWEGSDPIHFLRIERYRAQDAEHFEKAQANHAAQLRHQYRLIMQTAKAQLLAQKAQLQAQLQADRARLRAKRPRSTVPQFPSIEPNAIAVGLGASLLAAGASFMLAKKKRRR